MGITYASRNHLKVFRKQMGTYYNCRSRPVIQLWTGPRQHCHCRSHNTILIYTFCISMEKFDIKLMQSLPWKPVWDIWEAVMQKNKTYQALNIGEMSNCKFNRLVMSFQAWLVVASGFHTPTVQDTNKYTVSSLVAAGIVSYASRKDSERAISLHTGWAPPPPPWGLRPSLQTSLPRTW